jgi:uncharacterized OB-fold protein
MMTLLERSANAPLSWKGSLPVTNRYTYGLAGERFFRTIKDEGRIMGTYCPHCQKTYVPAVLFCEQCFGELDDWIDMGTIGEVHTFTILHIKEDGSPLESPEIVAFVKFGDGGLIHRLEEVDVESVAIGMNVEAVFKAQTERQGSILDIRYFRPII